LFSGAPLDTSAARVKILSAEHPDRENILRGDDHVAGREQGAFRRYYQVFFNEANLAAGEAMRAPDFIFHEESNPPIDQQEYMRRNAMFLRAFPDRILTIDFQVGEGHKVVTRSTLRGTHRGDLPGIPSTDRKVTITDRIKTARSPKRGKVGMGLG
jgi:predicted ester cyclase